MRLGRASDALLKCVAIIIIFILEARNLHEHHPRLAQPGAQPRRGGLGQAAPHGLSPTRSRTVDQWGPSRNHSRNLAGGPNCANRGPPKFLVRWQAPDCEWKHLRFEEPPNHGLPAADCLGSRALQKLGQPGTTEASS